MSNYRDDNRFSGIEPFEKRVLLASPTMHSTANGVSWTELDYIKEAFDTNWITCSGSNLNALESLLANYLGTENVVGLSCGTAAIHLAIKLAAQRLYGSSSGISTPSALGAGGCLYGKRVFCTDLTFGATVNPIIYEGGEPVFVDSEYGTWNMDPAALEKAFEIYPDVKLVIVAHLYGTPAKIDKIKTICEKHGALLIEDAAESMGTLYKRKQTSTWGDYGIVSFNGNKLITGSAGGALVCNDSCEADKARKWSTQSREDAPWYEHEELGYNYRMSNVIAGIIRGQMEYIEDHISAKKAIYDRYREGFEGLPIRMNPIDDQDIDANCWLSCLMIDSGSMAHQTRSERRVAYISETGKTCPSEMLDVLNSFNAEGRPIWKPMHLQPMYRNNSFITVRGNGRGSSNAYIAGENATDVSADIFDRGLCLPSDIKMTADDQQKVIEIIKRCFY